MHSRVFIPEKTSQTAFLTPAEGAQRQVARLQQCSGERGLLGVGREGAEECASFGRKTAAKIIAKKKCRDDINEAKFGNLLKGSFFNTHIYPSHFLPSADQNEFNKVILTSFSRQTEGVAKQFWKLST